MDCFVIAEAGTCHAAQNKTDRLRKALNYVDAAADCGADAVKFQWFAGPVRETMFCWFEGDERQETRWLASELDVDQWARVKRHAEERGLSFLASAFQSVTAQWLNDIGVTASKVASRAAKTFPYATTPPPHYVSLGIYGPDVAPADAVLFECEAKYPSTRTWRGIHPGFSDHSGGSAHAIDAMKRGCAFVEVHFCIEPDDAGPDLPASLSLDDLKSVCGQKG